MIQISNLQLPVQSDESALIRKVAKVLRVSPADISKLQIVRQSIDARKKDRIHMVYTIRVQVPGEGGILKREIPGVKEVRHQEYLFPEKKRRSQRMPVVAGMGPAGLFSALYLARNGIPCVVLERGKPVEERAKDVERFWTTGVLDTASNVQFGEGGAGTFSDGKLTTGTHDSRITTVLESLVDAGAPEDVLYSHKPHIGTDILRLVVANIRKELIALGCDVRFESQLVGIQTNNDRVSGVRVRGLEGEYTLETDTLILAIGHSARDTFELLHELGLPMEQKPFAIGVRIEHHQDAISRAQFGEFYDRLPPSDYKLSCHLPDGRSAFTFCVCPGGQVVASASEQGHLVTNGMSCRARDGENINGGFLVGVNPADYGTSHPLTGVYFQRKWEKLAYEAGGKNFCAPAQTVGDFLKGRASSAGGEVKPTYAPGIKWTDVGLCLPDYVTRTLGGALPVFDRKVRGFACDDAVLTGVETRSSSPVRILRDASYQSSLRGVYPCGEGCGYAGGIVSAAVDGVRVAESVACCEV